MLAHVRHDRTRRQEHAQDVDVHHLPPLVDRDFRERTHLERRVQPGVVHEDVDAAVPLHRLPGHQLDLPFVGNVDGEADPVLELPGRFHRPAEVGDNDSRSFGGKALGDCIADSLRRAGNDGDLAREGVAHRIGEKAVGTRIRFCWVWMSGWIRARKSRQRSSACSFERRRSRSAKFS